MPPVPPVTDQQARTLAAEILQRSEYARWAPKQLKLDLLEKLIRWLNDLLAWAHSLAGDDPLVYWLMMGILSLIVILLCVHIFWSVRVALTASQRKTPAPPAPAGTDFVGEAEELANAGRFLEAAHRFQLDSIDLLLRGRVVDLSRFEPNRTLRRKLRDARLPEAERSEILILIDHLERQWFRDRTEDRSLYLQWRSLHQRLGRLNP